VSQDIIGKRGEVLFRAAITKWCEGEQWFDERFLDAKAEALDFEVILLGAAVFRSIFFVQVKSTASAKRYSGRGKRRRLRVRLEAADAKKLGDMKIPAYVVGVDVLSGKAFIRHVPAGTKKGFTGISTRRPLNCRAIKKIWNEVDQFWKSLPTGMKKSSY
jgi:hypothetical protein